jgi:raffinose synthase
VELSASIALSLEPGQFEIVTLVPVQHGFAAIGLADKFNSSGAVREVTFAEALVTVELTDGGAFLALCERAPSSVQYAGKALTFSHDRTRARLDVSVPLGPGCLTIRF